MSGNGREDLPDVPEWSGSPHGCPGAPSGCPVVVGRPTEMSLSG